MLIPQQGHCAAAHGSPGDDAVTRLARIQHRALQLACLSEICECRKYALFLCSRKALKFHEEKLINLFSQ